MNLTRNRRAVVMHYLCSAPHSPRLPLPFTPRVVLSTSSVVEGQRAVYLLSSFFTCRH